MTFKELSKELGISSSKLMSLENKGVLRSRGAAALLGHIDDEDVRVIRLCCLFAILGVPEPDAFSILDGTADLKATLKKQVDSILSDESNYSQAAIVMQNIRRECSDIKELDPVPFLQHIKELKHSGGLFYDVNTGRIEEAKKPQNSYESTSSKKFGRFFSLFSTSGMDEFEEEELRKEAEQRAENEKGNALERGKGDTVDNGRRGASDSDIRRASGDNVSVSAGDSAEVDRSLAKKSREKADEAESAENQSAVEPEAGSKDSGSLIRNEFLGDKARYVSNPPEKTGTWNSVGRNQGSIYSNDKVNPFSVDDLRDNSDQGNNADSKVGDNRPDATFRDGEYKDYKSYQGNTENQEVQENRVNQGYQESQGKKENQGYQGVQGDKDSREYQRAQGYQETQENKDSQENEADSKENKARQNAGYDENWSPYTNRGLGASNMGTGNWHGWTPGYGTYSSQIGARARINNGEKTCPHPIRRFAARAIDTTMVSLLGGAVIRLGFRINISNELSLIAYVEIIFWLFEMMIEPLLLSSVGTTLGKWIMGISVRDMKTKNKLELKQAYIRSLKLAWYGFGLMIPIFTIFRRIVSFARCRINDTMSWDDGIDVELKDQSTVRIVLTIMILILLNVGDEIVAKQALIPKNRGEMTENQFYENVIEIMKYTEYPGDIPAFKVETRSGYVKSVTLKYSEEQVDNDRYNEMLIGFLAFAGASEDSNGFKLLISQTTSLMKAYYSSFQDSYCGININNSSDSAISDPGSYSMLLSMLYGNEVTIPSFNQTFTMSK